MPLKKHGLYQSSTYKTWQQMKARCTNPLNNSFKFYGAKGITYDPRWEAFSNFLEDMGLRPTGKTLDRIDNNKPYTKSNCRWLTPKEQANNRTNNIKVLVNGEIFTPLELVDVWGKSLPGVYHRVYKFFEYDDYIQAHIQIREYKTRNLKGTLIDGRFVKEE